MIQYHTETKKPFKGTLVQKICFYSLTHSGLISASNALFSFLDSIPFQQHYQVLVHYIGDEASAVQVHIRGEFHGEKKTVSYRTCPTLRNLAM